MVSLSIENLSKQDLNHTHCKEFLDYLEKSAISAVLANTTGIALFADHCKPNSSTAESVIGNNANNPRVISFMSFPLIIIS